MWFDLTAKISESRAEALSVYDVKDHAYRRDKIKAVIGRPAGVGDIRLVETLIWERLFKVLNGNLREIYARYRLRAQAQKPIDIIPKTTANIEY